MKQALFGLSHRHNPGSFSLESLISQTLGAYLYQEALLKELVKSCLIQVSQPQHKVVL